MKDPERQRLKEIRRAAKAEQREKAQQTVEPIPAAIDHIDCACLIHSTGYDWIYVERLYNMLSKNISYPIKFHVYTEAERKVPDFMIKHVLEEWPGFAGPKKSWWHKIQLFNSEHHKGNLLYFDLDTVVTGNLDWILNCDSRYFWAVRDFRRLWKPSHTGINSSVMWWDTQKFDWVWQAFKSKQLKHLQRVYHGDQDYISDTIDYHRRRFFENQRIVSWRWQALDGGMDFTKRKHNNPGQGTKIDSDTSLLIFHGNPKPHEVLNDAEVARYWV